MSTGQTAVETRVIGAGELLNGHGCYLVPSSEDPTRCYIVEQWPTRLGCTCKDHFFRHRQCKHIRAVLEHKQRLQLAAAEADRADAQVVEECASRGTAAPSPTRGGALAAKTPAHGRYFGARSQEPFSFMR